MKTSKIIMLEPSDLIVNGFQKILGDNSQFRVCGRCASIDELKELVNRYKPSLLIANPVVLGAGASNILSSLLADSPETAVMALIYQYVEPSWLKPYAAVIDIHDSKVQIENKLKQVVNSREGSVDVQSYELTQREKEVLVYIAKGLMNKEIADKLNLSVHTVISHRKNITQKTDIKSIAGLTVYALLNNLIDKDEVI